MEKKNRKRTYLGNINLGSEVIVSDPCYKIDSDSAITITNMLQGCYECFMEQIDFGEWGTRVASIEIRHEDYLFAIRRPTDIIINVDSGQAGIFDYDYFKTNQPDENWYDSLKCYRYVDNENYIPFQKTPSYAVTLLCFRGDLDAFVRLHPNTKDLADIFYHEAIGSIVQGKNIIELYSIDNYKLSEEKELAKLAAHYEFVLFKKLSEYNFLEENQKQKYEMCANLTGNRGIISSSGDGDGSYPCYVGVNPEGKVVAISIQFYKES